MNIHEHQAKELLKKFGANVPFGVFGLSVEEVLEKAKLLKTEKFVLKAQIHAGGRGKAGGVKILETLDELEKSSRELFGKKLVTHQTGPEGKEVKRLYVEESSNIEKEFYLSCLVDRATSKIAFITSDQGGMDIEEVAIKSPDKILTNKVELNDEISNEECEKIIKIFSLDGNSKIEAISLIKSIYKMFLKTDANMVEINPLILTKEKKIVCLDAKVNFDSNALFRHPEIQELRDLNEEDPAEIEASKEVQKAQIQNSGYKDDLILIYFLAIMALPLFGETERFLNWAKVLAALPSEIFYIFGAIVAASFGIKISNIFKK